MSLLLGHVIWDAAEILETKMPVGEMIPQITECVTTGAIWMRGFEVSEA